MEEKQKSNLILRIGGVFILGIIALSVWGYVSDLTRDPFPELTKNKRETNEKAEKLEKMLNDLEERR